VFRYADTQHFVRFTALLDLLPQYVRDPRPLASRRASRPYVYVDVVHNLDEETSETRRGVRGNVFTP
jgi:hypothetical protein